MRLNAHNIEEAIRLLESEFLTLKAISEMEDAGELHGSAGLYDDEASAFQSLETALVELKCVQGLL